MNATDENIGLLNNHLKNLNYQITVLAAKQDIASAVVDTLVGEMRQLREQQLQAAKQLRDIEMHQSGLYLWENIGSGG